MGMGGEYSLHILVETVVFSHQVVKLTCFGANQPFSPKPMLKVVEIIHGLLTKADPANATSVYSAFQNSQC